MTTESTELESAESPTTESTLKIPKTSSEILGEKKQKRVRRKSMQGTTVPASAEDLALVSPNKDYSSCSSADMSSDDTEPSSSVKLSKQASSKSSRHISSSSLSKGSLADAAKSNPSGEEEKTGKHTKSSSEDRIVKRSPSNKDSPLTPSTDEDEGTKDSKHKRQSSLSKGSEHERSHHHPSTPQKRENSKSNLAAASGDDGHLSPGNVSHHERASSAEDSPHGGSSKKLLTVSGDEADGGEIRERTASGGERRHRRHSSTTSRSQLGKTYENSSSLHVKKDKKREENDGDSTPLSSSEGSTHHVERSPSHSSTSSGGGHITGMPHSNSSSKHLNPDYSARNSAPACSTSRSEGDASSIDSDNGAATKSTTGEVEDEFEDALIVGGNEEPKEEEPKSTPKASPAKAIPTITPKKKNRLTQLLGRNTSFVAGEISPIVYMRQRPMAGLFILKQGVMFKKSLKTGRWKKRYVVVTPGQLCCFRDAADSGDPELSINLQYAVVRKRTTHDNKPAFDVVSTDNTLSLMATDNTLTQEWFDHISQAIERLVEESASSFSKDGNGEEEIHTEDNPAPVDKNKAALLELLQRPENHLCADCSRPDPQWASTNLGSFVCITCSGIHRGLGVHITKIRSISMDTWTDEQVAVMASKGNKKVNDYYLATLPPNVKVPTPDTPVEELKQFLHDKYVSLKYVPEEDKCKAIYANRVAPLQISHASISSDDVFANQDQGKRPKPGVNPPNSGRKSLTLEQHLMLMCAIRDDVVFRAELQRFIYQTDDGSVFKETLLNAIEKDPEFKAKLKKALLE